MKQKLTICAGLLALALLDAVPATAQYAPYYPGPGALPPYEVMAIVRSRGFDPLQGPVRRGSVYWVRAIDRSGQQVRVVVNAYMGRIVAVAPVGMRYAAPYGPPPYARPPGMVPNANGLNPRTMDPPYDDFDGPYGPPRTRQDGPYGPPRAGHDGPYGPPPVGPDGAAPRGVSPPRTATAPAQQPPLPRPRPKMAAVDTSTPAEATSPPPATASTGAATRPASVKPAAPNSTIAAKPSAPPEAAAKPIVPTEQHE